MRPRPLLRTLTCVLAPIATSCADSSEGADPPRVDIDIAALTLDGVADAVWDIEVVNGRAPTPDVVWRQRISSSRYGDGAGSATYIGPCDAGPGVATNTVRLWLVGLYDAPVTTLGTFAAGEDGGVVGGALAFVDPTEDAPIARTLTCLPNEDVPVAFDVSIMRPASQGFFDVAVSFDDIFCSAKLDCCNETPDGAACASDITLLHDADGERATSVVLGFACTGGAGTSAETQLLFDALALDCSSPSAATFAADFTVDPTRGPGLACAAGDVGACAAVTASGALDVDDYLFQVATYRGEEAITSGPAPANKLYWNTALGVRRKVGAGRGIEDCRLRARASAVDTRGATPIDDGVVPADLVYPYVLWDVDLATCQAEALTFGDPAAPVRTAYTGTSGEPTRFTFGYGPGMPPGRFACGDGVKAADEGCDDGDRDDGDGCSAECEVEDLYVCEGSPSVCGCALPDVFQWASWSTIAPTASGTVGGVSVSYGPDVINPGNPSNFFLQDYGQIPASFAVPNVTPTVRTSLAVTRTITFGAPVTDPVLLFTSIGSPGIPVTLTVSQPFEILFQHLLIESSATTLRSDRGHAIVKVAGTHTTLTVNQGSFENSVSFLVGFVAPNPGCPAPDPR